MIGEEAYVLEGSIWKSTLHVWIVINGSDWNDDLISSTTSTTTTLVEIPSCPTTGPGQNVGSISTSQINECSGLAASRKNPGLFWSNNDSGDR